MQNGINIHDPENNFIIIIDSMCNLDLLYYAAAHTGQTDPTHAATTHAKTLLRCLLRKEADAPVCGPMYSTFHITNFDPKTGGLKQQLTAQGYATESTWARG